VVIIRPQPVDVMASTVRPRSPPGRRNRCGRRPGVLELDEHQVLGVVVDVFADVYHVVVAVNTTVEVGPGVFGCNEQQVLRVLVDVVEQLSPVVCIRRLFSWWLFLRVLCTWY
jgi:hypothetical protein